MDAPRGPDDPAAVERPAPRLIEGRFASMEDKARWMLAGRERTRPDGRPEDSVDDALRRPETLETARTLLPGWSDRDVGEYVATRTPDRPWLAVLRADHSPEIWRTLVALDRTGHGPSRHGPYGDATMHLRRVMRLEDPAQPDPLLRERGIDGINGRDHYCASRQSRFATVEAMTTAYLYGMRDPRIKAVLGSPYVKGGPPPEIQIPIEDLLGPDGHEHCEGFRHIGDDDQSRADRKLWSRDRRLWLSQHSDLAGFASEPPSVEAIPGFEDGLIVFRFSRDPAGDGYLMNSHFPAPDDDN